MGTGYDGGQHGFASATSEVTHVLWVDPHDAMRVT